MNVVRFPHRRSQKLLWDGENFHGNFGGELTNQLAAIVAPPPAQIRGMLQALRQHAEMSLGHTAALLGVPKITVRSWIAGTRTPSRAARKLVWLLHALFVDQLPLHDMLEIAHWGRGPGEHRPARASNGNFSARGQGICAAESAHL